MGWSKETDRLARVHTPIWLLMYVQLNRAVDGHEKLTFQPAVLSNTVPHGLSLHYWVSSEPLEWHSATVLMEIGQGFIVQEPRGGRFVVQCWKHW